MKRNSVYKPLLFFLALLFTVQLACNLPTQTFNPGGLLTVADPVADMLSRTGPVEWSTWIEQLSGRQPVVINGEAAVITTRYNYAMFTGQPNARAFEYVLEQVRQWVPEDQIEIDEYPYADAEHTYTWKNLIVTLPGSSLPNEVIVLSAHLDSIVVREGNALEAAPGADDNATGVATLLEAARLFSGYQFERTIKIIFFTGEESNLAGSRAYVQDHPTDSIVGVLNLDMFGFDSNGDRCFEIHVGTLSSSDVVGQALTHAIKDHGLALRYDYLTTQATDRSDHTAFWEKGVPAVTVIQNFFDNGLPEGCQGVDGTPWYHRPGDTIDKISIPFAFDVAQASLIAVANLAVPTGRVKRW